jgi:hypothetical protein
MKVHSKFPSKILRVLSSTYLRTIKRVSSSPTTSIPFYSDHGKPAEAIPLSRRRQSLQHNLERRLRSLQSPPKLHRLRNRPKSTRNLLWTRQCLHNRRYMLYLLQHHNTLRHRNDRQLSPRHARLRHKLFVRFRLFPVCVGAECAVYHADGCGEDRYDVDDASVSDFYFYFGEWCDLYGDF